MNITLQNISKSYGSRSILTDFSLDIVDGMRLCVCGPNGCGKSTLIQIMAGTNPADFGRVIFSKNSRLGYVEQIISENDLEIPLMTWVKSALPDWNNFWQEWDKAQEINDLQTINKLMLTQHELEAQFGYNPEQKAQSILTGLGFSQDKWNLSLKKLSGGWRERAKLARVLVAGADILLLDEPTNHLDLEAVEWLEDFLLNYTGVLVFVAHDRVFMDNISTHILYLGASKPIFKKASFSKFLEMQEEIEEQKAKEAKKISEAIDHKMDFIRRFKAKATKARQASSRQKQAKKLEKELEQYRPETKRKELAFMWPSAARSEKVIISVADLDFQFSDGAKLWDSLTFTLYRGQRIGLVGPNGCGKSTLLKILASKLAKTGGHIQVGSLTKLGYYSQQQDETFNLANSVLNEMRRLSDSRTTEEELMSVLGLFMLGHNYFDRQINALSGGERSRLALALLFLARCNFLILDEPTNHLDLESREALTNALEHFDGTLLVVAHDRHLLATVVDEVWEIGTKGFKIFDQGFEQYENARKLQKANAKNTINKNTQNTTKANTKNVNEELISTQNLSREEMKQLKREQANQRNLLSKQLKPLQTAYENLELELEKSLEKQSQLENLISLPQTYEDGQKASELLKELHEIKLLTEQQLEELGQLEEKISNLKSE